MRKCMAALMLAMVMMVVSGCGGSSDAPVVGNWKLTEIGVMGVTMNIEEYTELADENAEDLNMEINIKGDGSLTATFSGESESGKWDYKEPNLTMSFDDEELKAEYQDGKLNVEMTEDGESMTMVFEK